MRIIKFFYIYKAVFSLNTHQNANNFLIFSQTFAKNFGKTITHDRNFWHPQKGIKKSTPSRRGPSGFYRSLWLCSWPSKIRSSTSAMNLFIVIAHPSFSQFSSWLYVCFLRFARRKLWFFCKLCVKCPQPRRNGTSSYAPELLFLFRKMKKSVYIPRGYYYNIRIFPDGTRQSV